MSQPLSKTVREAVNRNERLAQTHRVDFTSPSGVAATYANGFVGSICDEEDKERLVADGLLPNFADVAGHLAGDYGGTNALLWLAVLKLDPQSFTERQTTGDCVSHGTRNAVDAARAVEIVIKNEPEEWIARGATEPIYGCRGHGGQGMSCSQATRFVAQTGGLLIRQKYPELNLDLSTYNASIGSRWGSSGVPENVAAEGRKHQVVHSALINSVEECIAALHNGYGVHCCSSFGFSSQRDESGFSNPQGSWSHDMAWLGHATEGLREEGFLVQNSWGAFNSGPTKLGQAPGSFWITKSVAARMIGAGGTYAVGQFKGWPAKNLPDFGSNWQPNWTPV